MTRPRSAFGHGEPTERQRQAWEAVQRLGSQTAAARDLGITQGAIQSAMAGYQHAMGITGPLPGSTPHAGRKPKGEGVIAGLRRTLADANATIERLREVDAENRREIGALLDRCARLEAEARPFVAIHAKLDAILARPTGAIVPTHRRMADGGAGGRRERKGRAA